MCPRAILTNVIIEHGADAGPHQQREVALCGRLRFRLNLTSLVLGQGWRAHQYSEMRSEGERERRHGGYTVARKRAVILYLRGPRPGKQTCFVPKSEFGTGPWSDSDALPRSPSMCAYPQLAAPQSIVLRSHTRSHPLSQRHIRFKISPPKSRTFSPYLFFRRFEIYTRRMTIDCRVNVAIAVASPKLGYYCRNALTIARGSRGTKAVIKNRSAVAPRTQFLACAQGGTSTRKNLGGPCQKLTMCSNSFIQLSGIGPNLWS